MCQKRPRNRPSKEQKRPTDTRIPARHRRLKNGGLFARAPEQAAKACEGRGGRRRRRRLLGGIRLGKRKVQGEDQVRDARCVRDIEDRSDCQRERE